MSETSLGTRRFHLHLDACAQCRNNPLNLCLVGADLLREAVDEPGFSRVPPMTAPIDNIAIGELKKLAALQTPYNYQMLAARTLIPNPEREYSPEEIMLVWNALGLAGEAGEVADLIKKAVFHDQGLNVIALQKELGDVLWYVAALCTKVGISLDGVMQANIEKLKARYPGGWDTERSHKPGETPTEDK